MPKLPLISVQFTPRLVGEPFACIERCQSSRWDCTVYRIGVFLLFVEWEKAGA